MKTKRKNKAKNKKHEDDYKRVAAALAYVFEKQEEERKRETVKRKTQKFVSIVTFVLASVLVALTFVTDYSFNFSWMLSFGEWFNELSVSLYVYVFISGVVLLLEKKIKLDQHPWFGYTWPFVGFIVSMFLSKTMEASIIKGEFNSIAGMIMMGALFAYLIMSNAFKYGKEKANEEMIIAEKATAILKENPDIVDEVLNDYELYLKENETNEK